MIAQKAVRLLLLWLRYHTEPLFRPTDYTKFFGIDASNASRDIKQDLPVIDEMVEKFYPGVISTIEQIFKRPSGKSKVSFTVEIDHDTGEVEIGQITQKLYNDSMDQPFATVKLGGLGSAKQA